MPGFAVAVVLLTFAFSARLYVAHLSNHETKLARPVQAKRREIIAHERPFDDNPAKPQKSLVESEAIHPKSFQETDVYIDVQCTMAPESRFDCARDKLLSQRECEERGCCHAPLRDSAGPPWCFYPSLYPGYTMGPLTPTTQGQAASLTRAIPSHLPRDISTLGLEVTEETSGCLHLTVSS